MGARAVEAERAAAERGVLAAAAAALGPPDLGPPDLRPDLGVDATLRVLLFDPRPDLAGVWRLLADLPGVAAAGAAAAEVDSRRCSCPSGIVGVALLLLLLLLLLLIALCVRCRASGSWDCLHWRCGAGGGEKGEGA